MKKLFALFAISIGLIFSVSSCMDDVFSSSASDNITISTDSVKYDTVFTTIKQPTRILKLYNRNDKALRISSIYVAGGESSPFRLIVNGQRKQSFSDIDVFAKDSIYLFVDMELNANNSNLPVFISDSIYIVCNNVVKKVILNGFGQDVVILRDTIFSSSTTLTADKPYLVFGDMEVSENATLTISPGTVLYFHNNSGIKIKGTLSAIGSADKFIIMRGDRTDNIFTNTPYDSISNQWNGLEFISKGNNVLE